MGRRRRPPAAPILAMKWERVRGIEPLSLVWKTRALPLSYTRLGEVVAPSLRAANAGGRGWIRTSVRSRGQIYSLLPLTTRPPFRPTPFLACFRNASSACKHAPGFAERVL